MNGPWPSDLIFFSCISVRKSLRAVGSEMFIAYWYSARLTYWCVFKYVIRDSSLSLFLVVMLWVYLLYEYIFYCHNNFYIRKSISHTCVWGSRLHVYEVFVYMCTRFSYTCVRGHFLRVKNLFTSKARR